jgi:hypothetical protein
MVGPVKGPEQLTLIRRERFYHVPVSAIAAARTAVTHVAFYEPAARFGGPGAVRLYAAVRRVTRVTRRELAGVTWKGRHGPAGLYYRFDLGALRALPQPVTNPGRRRIVFRFVSLDRLKAATSLEDLRQPPALPTRRVQAD